jgi:hypothetical protein
VALPIIYFGLFDTIYTEKELTLKPYLYREGQSHQYFNREILFKQIISTLCISIFLVLPSYYICEVSISPSGYVIYEEWNGMLIFNIVVVSANIRIWNMSNQFNLFQLFLCSVGIVSFYGMFWIIEILLYADVKNTLNHMLTSWLYWLLLVFYTLVIEGWYYWADRLNYIKNKITQIIIRDNYEN